MRLKTKQFYINIIQCKNKVHNKNLTIYIFLCLYVYFNIYRNFIEILFNKEP